MARRPDEARSIRLSQEGGIGAGGLNEARHETLLRPGESPRSINIEYDRDSVSSAGGSVKFNNQVAPRSAIRCRPDVALSPLYFRSGFSVPLRGAAYFPYDPNYDIGGLSDSEGDFLAGTETFHNRRGRSFEINVSFRMPAEEKLYEAPTKGANAPGTPAATFDPDHGFDEALDDCTIILQKGGDRLAPMSWAIGVVNVGEGVDLTNNPPDDRPSNYALVFMWLDSPGWGQPGADLMKYNLTTGQNPVSGANSEFCTHAYRAVLFHKFVEPGRDYNLALQLSLDSGSIGDSSTNTSLNSDGALRLHVWTDREQYETFFALGSGTLSGCQVYKGPTDSAEYLTKYGVRYFGQDAMFAGLGARSHPFQATGFVPFGADLTALEYGGFAMLDRSSVTVAGLYGGVHSLTAAHTLGDAYVEVNHQGMVSGNTNGGLSPFGFGSWSGLGNGTTNFNDEALRGYRLITTDDITTGGMKGAVLNILSYSESGASYRLDVTGGAALGTWSATPVLVQAFRWNQRETVIGEIRIRRSPVDYVGGTDLALRYRRQLSISSSIDQADTTDPDADTLLAYWPCDDAEGSVLQEALVGGKRNGYLFPFGLGQSEGGVRGRMTFLSGEGEAPTIDLAEDPVLQRELEQAMQDPEGGFALEITCTFTEAFYAVREDATLPDSDTGSGALTGSRPLYVPDILTMEVPDPAVHGHQLDPSPLMALGFRGLLASTSSTPFLKPMAPSIEIGHRSDQEGEQAVQHQDLQPWYVTTGPTTVNRYDPDAPWVGRTVTIQIGFQPDRTTIDNYLAYIAVSPKDAFKPEDGDPSQAELVYWTDGNGTYLPAGYLDGSPFVIQRKDLIRSAITLGRRSPTGINGYSELQPRMLVEEVRVFPMPAPGELPATSGALLTNRQGKINSDRALPARGLVLSDYLFELGGTTTGVDLTEGSDSVTPSGAAGFTTGNPEDKAEALLNTLLYLPGDEQEIRSEETLGETTEEMYRVKTVASQGTSLTLNNAYGGGTRKGAAALAMRLAAYTDFEDDLRDTLLSLGAGTAYDPATAVAADAVLTQELWENESPVAANWRLRIFSPLGANSLGEVFPRWDRGMSRSGPKGNPILGLYGFDQRLYGTTKGALYEFDDRWRIGPDESNAPFALAFRGLCGARCLSLPQQSDRVEVDALTNPELDGSNDQTTYIDFWVKLDDVLAIQTAVWYGSAATNPELAAGASGTGHRIHYWARFNNGIPELCIGSTATYGSTGNRPDKGLFIASGNSAIRPGVWTHIRWVLETRSGTNRWQVPYLLVQGRRHSVRVNATDDSMGTPAATDWLDNSNVTGGDQVFLGAARDSVEQPDLDVSFVKNAYLGRLLRPQRYHGWVHSLQGELARVVVWEDTYLDGAAPADFDPFEIDYTGMALLLSVLQNTAVGVGHKIIEEAEGRIGVIQSHPAISLYHEMGRDAEPASFAEYGERVYVTNGGIVATIGPSGASRAGVLPPTTTPGFRIDRFPLWKPNARVAGGFFNDPVDGAADGAADQINHFDNHGNNYLTEDATINATGLAEIRWTADDSASPEQKRYYAFKCLVKLRETAGRIPIHDRRVSAKSGPLFVEVVDGKVRVGWYDVYQKRDVYVETSREIVEPGLWYYIYVRKRWPQHDSVEGNWQNQFWSDSDIRRVMFSPASTGTFTLGEAVTWTGGGGGNGRVCKVYGANADMVDILYIGGTGPSGTATGSSSGASGAVNTNIHPMNDSLVVRRFRGNSATPPPFDGWDVFTDSAERNCVSFTTDSFGLPGDTDANGLVSVPGVTYTGAAGGIVNADFGSPFHGDMLSAWFVFGTGAPEPILGRAYKIVAVNSGTQIQVQELGVAGFPDLSTAAADEGGVFMGCKLIKSEGFDESTQPDEADNSLRFFGTPLGVQPLTGIARFDGEFDSFGVTCINDNDGQDARVFENVASSAATPTADSAEVGTDFFTHAINTDPATGSPGQLRFDNWTAGAPGTNVGTWLSVHGQTYASGGAGVSTQPNVDVQVAKDATPGPVPSSDAPDLQFEYLESVSTFAQERYVRVRFRDPAQGARSQPGPELRLLPAGDDPVNPSGQIRYVITDLPAPRQLGDIEVEVYMSAAGGSATSLFQVATVPAGTKEVAVDPLEATISAGVAIDFGSLAPPRCRVIAASNGRMFYGAPEALRDGAYYSRLGLPVQIELGGATSALGFFRISGGAGDEVTLLRELDGFLVAAKRRALAGVTINETTGLAFVRVVSTGVGCVAHQSAVDEDDWLVLLGDKGFYRTGREGITDLAKPLWIGEKIEQLTINRLDRSRIGRVSGAYNRRRGELVMALQAFDTVREWQRVTIEPVGRTIRYGLQESPRVRCVASLEDRGGGIEDLVGGTEEGYVVWMDRTDTPLSIMGADTRVYGKPTVETDAAGTAYGVSLRNGSLEMDQVLDGPRGAPIVFEDANGVFRRATALWANADYLLYDESQAGALAVTEKLLFLGRNRRQWETPWLSLGDPEVLKALLWLDFVFKEAVSGKLQGEVQVADQSFEVLPKQTFEIDMTKGRYRQKMRTVQGYWLKVKVTDVDGEVGAAFELTDLILRVTDIGQR